uniref:PKD domain-containing protein n=1 Tax=Amphimedon queenslandica TaxID=400682 RepID=A0A1X7TN54_AMPQE
MVGTSKTSDNGPKGETLFYQWDLISGPLQRISGNRDYWTQPLLTLEHLNVGKYIFKLRVTDGDGAVGVAYANVTVQAEPDYPPTADAGASVLIQLPHDE